MPKAGAFATDENRNTGGPVEPDDRKPGSFIADSEWAPQTREDDMQVIFRVLCVLMAPVMLSGCGFFKVLSFSPDENSGIEGEQSVQIAFVNSETYWTEHPPRPAGSCTDTGCLGFEELPDEVGQFCVGSPPTPPPGAVELAASAAAVPFIVAGGQAAFDAIVGAIDSRRTEIRKAAVREYGTTEVVNDLTLGAFAQECLIVWRSAVDKTAMVSVYLVERHTPVGGDRATALTMTPLYLRVDRAAAQTERVSNGRAKINLNQTITIAAVQIKPGPNTNVVQPISTSPFSYSGVALGQGEGDSGIEYANPNHVPAGFFLNENGGEREDRQRLNVPRGPIFVPLREIPTVGSISVAVVERGSEADLDDVSATQKATRASVRAAIGSSIQEALKD